MRCDLIVIQIPSSPMDLVLFTSIEYKLIRESVSTYRGRISKTTLSLFCGYTLPYKRRCHCLKRVGSGYALFNSQAMVLLSEVHILLIEEPSLNARLQIVTVERSINLYSQIRPSGLKAVAVNLVTIWGQLSVCSIVRLLWARSLLCGSG